MTQTAQIGATHAINLIGLTGSAVLIEAALLPGLPNFTIVGLGDAAVNEARERLRAGLQNIGVPWPNKRLTINLSPADKMKSGSGFDLGIAGAILGALSGKSLDSQTVVFGEIGLDGEVRQVSGILPSLLSAQKLGFTKAIVPAANFHEAKLVEGIEIEAVSHLGQFAKKLGVNVAVVPELKISDKPEIEKKVYRGDLAEVCGQNEAIWALIIAGIGGHHVQMVGPPGVGKSMLASRFVDLLPPLTPREAVEVAAIKSVCGEQITGLPTFRPIVSPHHTASSASLIGGGNGIARPGAISRAHRGVLYCDEFPEFASAVIQSLRQPLEQGWIELHRIRASVRYPASFQLIAAANPCRCGYYLDAPGKCSCSPRERKNYRSALAGPIADRIDLQLTLRRPKKVDFRVGSAFNTAKAQELVIAGRERSKFRNRKVWQEFFQGKSFFAHDTEMQNMHLPGKWLRENTKLSQSTQNYLDLLLERGEISMRGIDRILRISWSVADYFGRNKPNDDDVAAAFMLRNESQNENRGKI